ncbi:MAG: mechanosensitive ion channel [Acidobacteriota bacterium]|nr:mechanosensitive ion channel [Acidobacteriota bacterium]
MQSFQTSFAFLQILPENAAKELPDWGNVPEAAGEWIAGFGIEAETAEVLGRLTVLAGILVVAVLAFFLARALMRRGLMSLVRRTRTSWDDALAEKRVFDHLAQLSPALVFYFGALVLFPQQGTLFGLMQRLALGYMVVVGGLAINAFLSAVVVIYETSFQGARERPILSYVQVAKIVLWVLVGVLLVAALMERSPWALLGGLGALTAVLLLVFKDAILGLVASIQLSGNDMVRVGDWISMPEFDADGDVMEISLTTVKVRNWDKTISTIPTYELISSTMKNWRGMTESGGRRIKRSLLIDLTSIRFLDSELLEKLRRIQILRPYLDERLAQVESWNQEHDIEESGSPVNGRRLTNIGTFRAYIEAYLRGIPELHDDMTFLVRQLAPTEKGLPMEVYVFSREQRWAYYEALQGDIFDHLLASAAEFDLRLVQIPTGNDLRALAREVSLRGELPHLESPDEASEAPSGS